ncbi:PQQ-dependent sugar dehydrogenase [Prosthecobacter dejongeii]|uniref:Putative repeat protein (TIGR03806 family) n=1 Tax=Prosthecobacter dejongeii TaxID=48465 RepID=A0A7W7YJ44_9BACT|nr:PQQ-dependent sugar dehydrogenase [Prosthecobacter dejongeii]MBB5037044.1 putative repeat protein (TIGR03806 family) [Prosthecobacter dejongeii]
MRFSLVLTFLRLLCLLVLTQVPLHGQIVRQANTSLYLPATTPPETSGPLTYAIVSAFPGVTFNAPMGSTYPTGETSRVYVNEREGKIWIIHGVGGSSPTKSLFMDLAAHLQSQNRPLATDNENGLLAMAFHPDYQQNGWFYLFYSIRTNNQLHQRLARFTATGTAGNFRAATSASAATESPLLTLYDRIGNHNGGDLGFGGDGYLYLSLGDEGGGDDEYNNARFIDKNFWGQMLRLDVNNLATNQGPSVLAQTASTSFPSAIHPGTYKVPADNPFIGRTTWHGRSVNPANVKREIYATGFRNPFRFNFDPTTGRLFLGDVGQNTKEEVDLVVKGGDYGWSWREGDVAFNGAPKFPNDATGSTTPPSGANFSPVSPIISYPRTSAQNPNMFGASVCAGIVYRGTLLPELRGMFWVADIYSGRIRAYQETTPGVWTGQGLPSKSGIVDFGINPSTEEPLLCCLNDGLFYKIVRGTASSAPMKLSEVGVFRDMSTLATFPGFVRYRPNVSFWSDGAIKERWFAIKETTPKIGYSETGNWTFPTGTVWVKHFEIPVNGFRRRLETRLLVKTADGVYGLTYKWTSDTEAYLVPAAGETSLVPFGSSQYWRYPSRSECLSCHTAAAGYALGFNTAQINGPYPFAGTNMKQLDLLNAAGYLSGMAESIQPHLPALSTAPTQSLEWRARSYLAVNCAPCHQPGGGAQGNWDARYVTPTELSQIIQGSLINQGADPDSRVIVPGDTEHSMLLKRMQGEAQGLSRMPPVGSLMRDVDGENLIASWIQELSGYQTLQQWLDDHFGAAAGPNAAPAADADGDGLSNQEEYALGTNPQSAASRWKYDAITKANGRVTVNFTQPANRMALVEISHDLITWRMLTAVDNEYLYPAAPVNRSFYFPLTEKKRFFRVRLRQP